MPLFVQFRAPSLCIPSDSVGTEPFGSITAQGRREVCPALLLERTFNMPYTRAHSHLASLLLGFPQFFSAPITLQGLLRVWAGQGVCLGVFQRRVWRLWVCEKFLN